MLCQDGRVALASFTSYAVLLLYQVRIVYLDYWSYHYTIITLTTATATLFVLPHGPIVKRAALLGSIFGASLAATYLLPSPWHLLTAYWLAMATFHMSEYIMTALYNQQQLSTDSFLINHSTEYHAAALLACLEFLLEAYLLPSLKHLPLISAAGALLVLSGEVLRKVSMTTAKSNFTHVVQDRKRGEHVLVTWGVYSWSRHPSYVGWFYWSIGTQVMLCNPICFLLYAYAAWRFFKERVRDEEFYLFQFFGQQYVDYVENVPTRLPFIRGLYEELKPLMKHAEE